MVQYYEQDTIKKNKSKLKAFLKQQNSIDFQIWKKPKWNPQIGPFFAFFSLQKSFAASWNIWSNNNKVKSTF